MPPASDIETADASWYAVTVQPTHVRDTPSPSCICGNTTKATVRFIEEVSSATDTTAKTA